MNRLRAVKTLENAVAWIGALDLLLVFVMVALPTLEAVVMRSVLNRPTLWTQELTTLVFGVYFMMGGAYCEKLKGHVAMDVIYNRFGKSMKRVADILGFVCVFVFCGVLTIHGAKIAWAALLAGERSESLWRPIIWPVRWAIPVSAVLVILQSLVTLLERLGLFHGERGVEG